MFSFPLATLVLAAFCAYANPIVRAVGGLEVSLSTPTDKVASVSDLRVVATVKNVGNEDLRILKSGTVLDNEIPTRSFIVSKDGKETPFTGITVYLSADLLSEKHWVVIPAGETVTAEHNVSDVYDFSASGPGTFVFDPISRFHVIGPNSTIQPISDAANAGSVSVTITDVPAAIPEIFKRKLNLGKRSRNACKDPKKTAFLDEAITESRELVSISTLNIVTSDRDDPLYKDYFGSNPGAMVTSLYSLIHSDETDWRLDCEDPLEHCKTGPIIGFTAQVHRTVFFCDRFFEYLPSKALCDGRTNPENRNLRGGTLLHELTHAMFDAADISYPCADNKKLPDDQKIKNAATYQCYAIEVYKKKKC